jgi:DNA-directed RNA polymerase specialized sigma24 family protein
MPINRDKPHVVLREVYKHYLDFYDFYRFEGIETIEYQGFTINFLDLKDGLSDLSDRKKEAFYYHVIRDMRQQDVADIMGVTTVTVGQYVDAACRQLAKRYWAGSTELFTTKK